VKDASRERGIHLRLLEHVGKMANGSGPSGRNQRHLAHFADGGKLLEVISAAHAIAVHAVEHNFPCTPELHLPHPVEHVALACV